MLNEILPHTPSIDLRFRMNGRVFKIARLRARTKAIMSLVRELQYDDNNATPSEAAEDLQTLADTYNTAYTRCGMQVNTNKTKKLVKHPPGQLFPNTDTELIFIYREHLNMYSHMQERLREQNQGSPLRLRATRLPSA